ncbi:hypothetical protein JL720_6996 [Aureococcus anophagefferens]|nr:hypothetical protein JL720_6996 [Aureococcus anophagefferens]
MGNTPGGEAAAADGAAADEPVEGTYATKNAGGGGRRGRGSSESPRAPTYEAAKPRREQPNWRTPRGARSGDVPRWLAKDDDGGGGNRRRRRDGDRRPEPEEPRRGDRGRATAGDDARAAARRAERAEAARARAPERRRAGRRPRDEAPPYAEPPTPVEPPTADEDRASAAAPSPTEDGSYAAAPSPTEDATAQLSETMAVLFELLPFYNQGNRGTDGVVRRAIGTMTPEDCRTVDGEGSTALIVCAQYGHDDLADLLLRRGAEVNAVSAAGVTALAYACGSEAFSEPMIRLLLSREADANVAELHYGCCALHYLAATGDARLCGLLVEHGADAAAVDWAVAKAREEVGDKARKLEAELEKTVAALGACEFEKKALLRKLDDQAGDVGALRRREEEAARDVERAKASAADSLDAERRRVRDLEAARDARDAKIAELEAAVASARDEKTQFVSNMRRLKEAGASRETMFKQAAEQQEREDQERRAALEAQAARDRDARDAERAEEQERHRDADASTARATPSSSGAPRTRARPTRPRGAARERAARDAEACAAARARADDADRARASAEQHVRDVDAEIRHAAVVEKRNDQLDRDLVKEVKRRKELHNTLEDMKGRIRVYLRVRPLSTKETDAGAEPACGRAGATGVTVKRADRKPPQDKQHFEFDRVFAGDAEENSQQTVFADVKSLVLSCVDGFNVCIFAYGQSGSGKTFTMAGAASIREAIDVETWNLAPLAGIIPRSAVEVFRMLEERSALAAYEVELSMYELYRDSLRDLFAAPVRKGAKPVALNVKLAQFSDSGLVQVEGGVTRRVQSLPDLVAALEAGLEGRSVAHTELNAESSRSHLIVTLVLKSTNHRSGHVVCGKLTLVDLAGSERVEKSGVAGDKLKEAMSINKSLSAIGDVINALSSGQKHVPYRNHPLTMLMSDSIGGSAKTLMFVNASPADTHVSETVSSLTFGSRCKRVKNASNANGEMASQLKDLKAELDRMKQSGATRAKKAHAPGDVRRPGGNR